MGWKMNIGASTTWQFWKFWECLVFKKIVSTVRKLSQKAIRSKTTLSGSLLKNSRIALAVETTLCPDLLPNFLPRFFQNLIRSYKISKLLKPGMECMFNKFAYTQRQTLFRLRQIFRRLINGSRTILEILLVEKQEPLMINWSIAEECSKVLQYSAWRRHTRWNPQLLT